MICAMMVGALLARKPCIFRNVKGFLTDQVNMRLFEIRVSKSVLPVPRPRPAY